MPGVNLKLISEVIPAGSGSGSVGRKGGRARVVAGTPCVIVLQQEEIAGICQLTLRVFLSIKGTCFLCRLRTPVGSKIKGENSNLGL